MKDRTHRKSGFLDLRALLYQPEAEAYREAQAIQRRVQTIIWVATLALSVICIGIMAARAF